ncbi:DUF7511 domain-containing protein [Halopiger xanaduensis]|nr:hypothetical protein [Halopiger xanaduensis]
MSSDIDTDSRSSPTASSSIALECVVIENDDAPNECAVYPRDADRDELMTTWITAHDDAFVELESMR